MLNSVKTALLHGGVDPVPVHAFPVRTERHSLVNSPALAALRTPPGAPRASSSRGQLNAQGVACSYVFGRGVDNGALPVTQSTTAKRAVEPFKTCYGGQGPQCARPVGDVKQLGGHSEVQSSYLLGSYRGGALRGRAKRRLDDVRFV